MDGNSSKVAIVTGSNVGIGKVTALELAKNGFRVILACRNVDTAENARLDIVQETGNNNIFVRELDLGSLTSVRKFAEDIITSEVKLDLLINNAGIMRVPFSLTVDGFESHFGVNHLGHFLLTILLLDLLKKADAARIVVLSSTAAQYGQIKFDDIHYERRKYGSANAYMQSKLANMLFVVELSTRLADSNVTVYAVHPGVVNTELYRNEGFFTRGLLWPVKKLFMKTAEQGAKTSIYCALTEGIEKDSGKYFTDSKVSRVNARCIDKDNASRLWKASEEMVGLTSG